MKINESEKVRITLFATVVLDRYPSSSEAMVYVRMGTVVTVIYCLTCLPVLFVFSSEAIELQCFVPFSTISLTISSSWRKTIFREM